VPQTSHARQLTPPSARWALASLSLTMLLSSLGTSIANVALPTFVHAFGTSFQAVQWVVLAYLLAVTTLIVSVGRLGDLFGRRRLMLVGIALFTVASMACGVASDLWMLIAARAVQGLGAAVMMALTMALVGDAVPQQRAGSAMGFLGTMSAVGTALGPSLGGVLIAVVGWRSIFLINLPLGLVALLLAYRYLPADRQPSSRPSFDFLGSALLALTLAAYALSMTLGREGFGAVNGMLLCAALTGAGLFLAVESRVRSPLVRLELFRNDVISAGFAMSSMVTTVAMTTLVVGPFYLAGALHLNPADVGLVMTSGPLVAALVGVPAGRGVDRFGARRVAVAGLVCMALGCVLLALVPVSFGIVGYVVPLVMVTAGFAIFQAANNTAVVTGVEASQRGVVSGLLNLARNLGLITGASLMGAVFAHGCGTTDIASAGAGAIVAGAHVAFAIAAAFVICALFIALAFSRQAQSTSSAC
jgi:EmrB/QacA subfamily drug resistance transporter